MLFSVVEAAPIGDVGADAGGRSIRRVKFDCLDAQGFCQVTRIIRQMLILQHNPMSHRDPLFRGSIPFYVIL
jgi:hypothetical protein